MSPTDAQPPSAPFPNEIREALRRAALVHGRAAQLAVLGAENPIQEADRAAHLTNLAFALRNLLRIAERASDVPGVSEAKAKFEAAVPGVKDARDVLEHFDDYSLGDGRLQARGEVGEFFTAVQPDGKYVTLNIAGRYRISTEATFPAALELAANLLRLLAPGRAITAEPRRSR